jgi:hypothetical protein
LLGDNGPGGTGRWASEYVAAAARPANAVIGFLSDLQKEV